MAEPQIDSFFMQPSGAQTSTAPVGAPAPAVPVPSGPVGGAPPSAPPAAQPAPAPSQPPIPPAYQPVGTFYPPAQTAPPVPPGPAIPEVMPQPPVQAPAPQPAPAAQPTQQQVSDALQAAQQLGIDVGRFKDGADLVNTMWATVQAMNQELEQQRAQYQAMVANQAAGQVPGQPAAGVPAAPDGFKWDVPQYDPLWDQYPDDPSMQARKREYMQARNKTADRVLSQFPDLVKQVVGPELAQARQQMQEAIKQEIAQYRYDQQVEAMEAELAPHLYQTDLFGRRTLTPWGEKVTSTVRAYVEQGVQDPLWVMQQAKAIVGPPPGAQQAPVQAQAPVPAAATGVPAQVPGGPTAGQIQPGSVLPGTNFQVVPVTTIQLRGPDGRIVSPAQLSEQQKQTFLAQAAAARATHVPQVGTTPADIQSRPVTEADLANWFLPQAG